MERLAEAEPFFMPLITLESDGDRAVLREGPGVACFDPVGLNRSIAGDSSGVLERCAKVLPEVAKEQLRAILEDLHLEIGRCAAFETLRRVANATATEKGLRYTAAQRNVLARAQVDVATALARNRYPLEHASNRRRKSLPVYVVMYFKALADSSLPFWALALEHRKASPLHWKDRVMASTEYRRLKNPARAGVDLVLEGVDRRDKAEKRVLANRYALEANRRWWPKDFGCSDTVLREMYKESERINTPPG